MRIFLTSLIVLLTFPAFAQEDEADATYDQRVELAKQMHEIWPTRLKVERAFDQAAERLPESDRLKFKAAMRKATNFDLLEETSIEAMVDLFTAQELEEMVAFYGSSTGRSITAKTEEYQARIAPVFSKMMDTAVMDVRTRAREEATAP